MRPFTTEESGGSTIQRSATSARKTRLLGGYVSPLTDPAPPVAGLTRFTGLEFANSPVPYGLV